MKTLYCFLFLFGILTNGYSQRTFTWNNTNGDWNDATKWTCAGTGCVAGAFPQVTALATPDVAVVNGFTGTIFLPATGLTCYELQINGNSVVNFSNNTAAASVTFQPLTTKLSAGSQATLSTTGGGPATWAFNANNANKSLVDGELILDGTSTQAVTFINSSLALTEVNGILRANGANTIIATSGAGNLKFNANSTFVHNKDSSLSFLATYDPSSLVRITGIVNTTLSPISNTPTYGNVEWNNAAQNVNLGFASNMTFNNFSIVNTNGKEFRAGTDNSQTLTVNGNLSISATALVNMSAGSTSSAGSILAVKGNFSNAGTITETGSTTNSKIQLSGTSVQSISQTGSMTQNVSLELNNPAGFVATTDLILPAGTGSKFSLISGTGNLDMGANLLFIQNPLSSAIPIITGASHVIGKIRRATNSTGTYNFPVGSSVLPNEAATVSISPLNTSLTVFEVSFVRPNPYNRLAVPAGVVNAGNYVWNIARVSGVENADVSLVYKGNNFVSGNSNGDASLQVLRWNGASWDNLGGTGSATQIAASNVTTFSAFTLGTTGPVGLPVTLLDFSALRQGSAVSLKWDVAQEQDLKDYEIERSANGQNWISLASINSLGNTANQRTYAFADNNAGTDKLYYRLRVVNNAGSAKLSKVVIVSAASIKVFSVAALYPNPVGNTFTLQVQSTVADKIFISLVDAQGHEILQQESRVEKGTNAVSVGVVGLPAGAYTLQLRNSKGETLSQKIIKQ